MVDNENHQTIISVYYKSNQYVAILVGLCARSIQSIVDDEMV